MFFLSAAQIPQRGSKYQYLTWSLSVVSTQLLLYLHALTRPDLLDASSVSTFRPSFMRCSLETGLKSLNRYYSRTSKLLCIRVKSFNPFKSEVTFSWVEPDLSFIVTKISKLLDSKTWFARILQTNILQQATDKVDQVSEMLSYKDKFD